jgi:hypothetical protein
VMLNVWDVICEWTKTYSLCFDTTSDDGAVEAGDGTGCVDYAFRCPGTTC